MYTCHHYPELDKIKFLVPNFYFLGANDEVPGLLMRYLSPRPNINESVKILDFFDVYLKNVEIEMDSSFEDKMISETDSFRRQKYGKKQNKK